VSGAWRRLHNEEFYNLYASPNIIRAIKSRRKRWAGHVELMREMRNAHSILVGNLKGRDHAEELGVYGSIILKWILGN